MTAGTVVITGGILATVILLCIITVLCYCRLQYYCCKKNGSDQGSVVQSHFAGTACTAPGLDGAAITTISPSPDLHSASSSIPAASIKYCPTCLPEDSPFYTRTTDELRNSAERMTCMPTHYEKQAVALTLPVLHGSLLRTGQQRQPAPDFYTNICAISTEV